jgi:hypothetical protein
MGGIFEIINRVYPTWLVTTADKYCDDYPHLTKTWIETVQEIGVKPAKIVIVSYFHP